VESVRWRHRDTRAEETHAIRNVFMFLGADPMTDWLGDCGVAVDDTGFIRTGNGRRRGDARRQREVLARSEPCRRVRDRRRARRIGQVGAAIGEGAAVVAQIHAFLEASRRTSSRPTAVAIA
jgi:thioredoxin reductase (NADPH)